MINLRSVPIVFYFAILLIVAPVNLLSFDTYYYWNWSRHLALSYYDGSPMIAYFIRLSTMLFGDTLFALSFVGIIVSALTAGIIYKTARFFLNKEASYVATLLWLFSPLVTMDIVRQTTYDTPLTLFWALSLYYVVKFLKFNQTKDLYFVGLSIGLMMLSKYSGIVLVFAFFIFLITTKYRYLFKAYYFYLALLLSLIIFSPVIIWNYQHEWISFIYQLTTHQLSNTSNPFLSTVKSYLYIFVPTLNFMLLPALLVWLKRDYFVSANTTDKSSHNSKENILIIKLIRVICTTFICFYLFTASKATIREYWLTPYLITSALLAGLCFQTFYYRKSAIALIVVYWIVSVGIVANNTYQFSIFTPKKLIYYHLIQQFNTDYPELPKIIFTSGWLESRMLYFLKNKPEIYTLDCGSVQNQYALWSVDLNHKVLNKTLKEAMYIDKYESRACLKKYFDKCERLPTKTYSYSHKEYHLYAYHCVNE